MADKIAAMITGQGEGRPKRCFAPPLCQVVHPRQLVGDRQWSLTVGGEDQGLDRFSFSTSRVLSVKIWDCFSVSIFQGPYCNLYPQFVN
jgi:hypothetical protein